jgi:hypothetical protein
LQWCLYSQEVVGNSVYCTVSFVDERCSSDVLSKSEANTIVEEDARLARYDEKAIVERCQQYDEAKKGQNGKAAGILDISACCCLPK